jgi:O-succinylbenzoic acid--CoA ligase
MPTADGPTQFGDVDAWPTRDLIAVRAATTPDRDALVDAPTDTKYSYRELDALVEHLCSSLVTETPTQGDDDTDRERGPLHRDDDTDRERGPLHRDDDDTDNDGGPMVADDAPAASRVAVLSDPRPALVGLVHAAWRTGTELVVLDGDQPPSAVASRLAHVDATALLVDDAHRECGEATQSHESTPSGLSVSELPRATALDDLASRAPDRLGASVEGSDVASAARVGHDHVPVTLFTSGSTGTPKAVGLTVGNLLASATASAFRLGVKAADRWVSPLPTHHMGGLAPAIRCALYGSTVVLQREFDAETTAAVLERYDATGISLVPTALLRLLDADWTPDPALRFVLLGGAPARPALIERCERANVPIHPTYGMTETASQIATATPAEAFANPETVGRPLVNTTVRVLDADGTPLPPGETGELVVDAPTVTPGYLTDESTTSARDGSDETQAFSRMGFHTGDSGYRDADGRLYVTGRLDEMIVTGGENVQPAVVEDALAASDDVTAAAVVGVNDEEWGERVVALVVPTAMDATDEVARVEHEPSTFDESSVLDAVRDRVPPHAVPKRLVTATAVPRTASGTVDRDAARELIRELIRDGGPGEREELD